MAQLRIDQLNIETISPADLLIFWKTNNTFAMTKESFDLSIGDVSSNSFRIVDTHKAGFDISGLSENRTYALPNSSTELIGVSTAQTITNKTISPVDNTIDGDVLDIDYIPTQYTRTPGTPGTETKHLSAHLRGINNVLGLIENERQEVYYVSWSVTQGSQDGFSGGPATTSLTTGQSAYFNFILPLDYQSIESIHLLTFDLSGTPSVSVDIVTRRPGTTIGSSTTQTISITNTTLQLRQFAISTATLTNINDLVGGDFIGFSVSRQSGTPRIAGIKITLNQKYVA